MKDLIISLIVGETITEKDLEDALYEICEDTHATCDIGCPVYELNGHEVPNYLGTRSGCDCFKNGKSMLDFIRKELK